MNKLTSGFRITRVICLALFLVVVSTAPVMGQAGAPYAFAQTDSVYANAIMQARELLQTHMDTLGIPGVTAAVLVDGQIVWSEGFGFADIENRVPVWPGTKMRIGSVSKSLTSIAIALLYEQGKLDLDAPVQKYVPSFPEKKYPITTRQLAGHLAGIRHYRGREFLSSRHYDTVVDGLSIFEKDTLLYRPGDKYSYSSYGWNLVSAVIESVAQKEFLSYMRENVFKPLGMRHTVAEFLDSIIYNRSRFYERNDNNELINAPFVDNSYKWAGGGYLSTAEDLALFGDKLINSDFLKPETVKLLFSSQKTNSGEATRYGLGWRSWQLDDLHFIGHGGGSVGGSSVFVMLPEGKSVVALICNFSGGRLLIPGLTILRLFTS